MDAEGKGALGWVAVAVLVAAGLGRSLAMMATTAVLVRMGGPTMAETQIGWPIGIGLLAGTAAGSAVLVALLRDRLRRAAAIEPVSWSSLWAWAGMGLALTFALDGVAWLQGRPVLQPEWVSAVASAPVVLLGLALVGASAFEEIYFRGLLYGVFARRIGAYAAIVVTALLFALAHFPGDGWRFLEVLVSGAFLGVCRLRTGSAVAGIAPHVLGNLKVLAYAAAP